MHLRHLLSVSSLLFFALGCTNKSNPKSDIEKKSYSLGVQFAQQYKKNNIPLDLQFVSLGVEDVLKGKDIRLSDDEIKNVQLKIMNDIQIERSKAAQINHQDAQKKMDEFLKQPGVKATASGLLYNLLTSGKGTRAKKQDTVVVAYTGRLLNGLIFDSSEMHGRDGKFKLDGVIPGLSEALMLAPAGSKLQVLIPPKLGYGESGNATIPPNSPLLFDLEIKAIQQRE